MAYCNWTAIFDWDGVIIDSSKLHEEGWELLAKEENLHLPKDHFLKGFGMKNETVIPNILNWTRDPKEIQRLSQRKEELYRMLLEKRGIEPLPGVKKWLEALMNAGVTCYIASSTYKINIEIALEKLKMNSFFSGIVAAEDVTEGKPDPSVFLLASQFAGKTPSECIVFEDVPKGIEAARRAGMKVVAVSTTHPVYALSSADAIVDRLDMLNIQKLQDWFQPAEL
ncbi:MAG: HAD-IA family hydrolase [Candidatus Theseobacter exili]|nr:HAD-IA family hydrolase [Candidatus Theseobacter exili]